MKTVGLKRLTVKLFPHNRKWRGVFGVEARKIRKLIPHVEHIGSTAINGIKAKPIIDMLAGIPSMKESKDYIKPLAKLGFELRPFGIASKHLLFVKGKEKNRTHYLHLVKHDGQIWKSDLFFRDYLNRHRGAAKTYEKLKIELAGRFAQERPKYTKAKWQFIKNILDKRK